MTVIHPDKTPHARAPEAFDILKKVCSARNQGRTCGDCLTEVRQAESELGDTAKREELDAAIRQARNLVLKDLGLPPATPADNPKLDNLKPPFKEQLRAKSKQLLIEEEVRRRK